MNEIIYTSNLSKYYRKTCVLKEINISIAKGSIYGLIGENGAGKTTLIKILTGNTFKTSGTLSLFGVTDNLAMQRKNIGAIIEAPAFCPNMSAYENLNLHALQCGIENPKRKILKVLELVGLENTTKKAKYFSLGMKQRLGLAFALLNNPEFLILDEPMNGLDPVGILELRELLKKLNKEKGITILISSHLLKELSNVATQYGFISKGSLLKEISSKELNEECKQYLHLKTNDIERTITVLKQNFEIDDCIVCECDSVRLYNYLDKAGEITSLLALSDISVSEVSMKGDDLEKYYMKLIGVDRNV